MRAELLASTIVLPCLTMAAGCSAGAGTAAEGFATESQGLAACPSMPSSGQAVFREAASLALTLMVDEAERWGSAGYTMAIMSVLAPHRYRLAATGIEFDPNDRMYSAVTDEMQAHLAFAQKDPAVAQFLAAGLSYAYANTNGTVFPRLRMANALGDYKYPGPVTGEIYDSTTPSPNADHSVTVVGATWCGGSVLTLSDTVKQSTQYSPLDAQPITANLGGNGGNVPWYTSPPAAFKGKSATPWTPFNGSSAGGNPYLIVTVNDKVTNWSTYDWGTVNCNALPNATCTGSLEIDPVPYAEPGTYYSSNGALLGTQSNPYTIVGTLYATADHQGQWAIRVVNGTTEVGTFRTAVTLFGVTEYGWQQN